MHSHTLPIYLYLKVAAVSQTLVNRPPALLVHGVEVNPHGVLLVLDFRKRDRGGVWLGGWARGGLEGLRGGNLEGPAPEVETVLRKPRVDVLVQCYREDPGEGEHEHGEAGQEEEEKPDLEKNVQDEAEENGEHVEGVSRVWRGENG